MTRYEYNYSLQDLLGLPFDFAKDLPPESPSDDGFQNSSELLHMSPVQFDIYRESSLRALKRATVKGDRPAPLYWGVSMEAASASAWAKQQEEVKKLQEKHQDDPEKLRDLLERRAARLRRAPRGSHYKT